MTEALRGPAEFELIDRIRARVPDRYDVVLGIGDDAALLRVPPGKLLVIATDTLNAGVHFRGDTAPADIGWKALAVNLSDLAAMGAEPAWCTLSLSLPEIDPVWVDGFLDGFLELATAYKVALVGGDTTRGPLSICVSVHGLVEPDRVLRRDSAQIGDDLWVTGTLGDAAGALAHWHAGRTPQPVLQQRLDRPTPRIAAGQAVAHLAHACIDVSDGLLADLCHVCVASDVGALVQIDALPASEALQAAFAGDARRTLQGTGGDDYELCFTAAVDARLAIHRALESIGVQATLIGRIVAGQGVRALRADGSDWIAARTGYVHFA